MNGRRCVARNLTTLVCFGGADLPLAPSPLFNKENRGMPTHATPPPIAVQLYSLRDLPGSFEDTLAQVAAAGFTAVESLGDHGYTAAALRELLDRHGLQVVSAHVQLDTLRNQLDDIMAFNQAIGNQTLVVAYIPWLRGELRAQVYQETGQLLGELGRHCNAAGMQLLYHNHDWEMAAIHGKLAIDWLLESADPHYLGFEPDLAWMAAANVDPVGLLQRYAGRCPRVHIKDLAPNAAASATVVMEDVGYGTLDWPRLLAAARDAGAAWYIIEHDNPADPIASVSRSLAYLRQQLPAILQR
jgi:sugar phosphate isomerase/epimerase